MHTEILASEVENGKTVVLRKRGDAYDVVLGNVVLLSSAALETELSFGHLAAQLLGRAPSKVIVGGLGFGATTRGVLEGAHEGTRVLVAEKLAAVERFVRGPAAHLAGSALSDPRVEIVRDDVADVIARERDVDAILLDVDNGPDWASFRSNARLYSAAGLAEARASLAPGGIYAVWSGYPADAFVGRIRAAGMQASITPLKERGVVRARAYVGVNPK